MLPDICEVYTDEAIPAASPDSPEERAALRLHIVHPGVEHPPDWYCGDVEPEEAAETVEVTV